jgi:glycine dehydrogenase subunit 1
MGSYIPNTEADRREMLSAIGRGSIDKLFRSIPEEALLTDLKLPPGLAEMDLVRKARAMAEKNKVFPVIFRGAGAYRHYIPAAVKRIASAETFVTAYTPYQAEISQGILQSIFEYQTMICALTGMDASNASVYDGAGAAGEGVSMCRDRNRTRAYVSAAAHPQTIETIRTYCWAAGAEVTLIPAAGGRTSLEELVKLLAADKNASCVYLQSPNFFGLIEEVSQAAEITHAAGALLAVGVNPISLGILESPGACGADIACGEDQPRGLPLAFGGPYLGFMACKGSLMRKLPGRIVGETVDSRGERAFVLTLQAREQHIRREKASSNICSNEAHCALTAAVYLAIMGEGGVAEAARQCHAKAVYAAGQIASVPGFSLVYDGEFFNEFVTRCPDTEKALKILEDRGILGGYPLEEGRLLWCVTEVNTRDDIDRAVSILKEEMK